MITANESNIIKNALKDIDHERVILFGSRARGDNRHDSDFDIMVVVPKKISIQDKFRIQKIIRTNLAMKLLDADVIVQSNEDIIKNRNRIGSIIKEAILEGREL